MRKIIPTTVLLTATAALAGCGGTTVSKSASTTHHVATHTATQDTAPASAQAPAPAAPSTTADTPSGPVIFHPGETMSLTSESGPVADVTLNGFKRVGCDPEFSDKHIRSSVGMSVTVKVSAKASPDDLFAGVPDPSDMEVVQAGKSTNLLDAPLCLNSEGNFALKQSPENFLPGSTYTFDIPLGDLTGSKATVKYMPTWSSNMAVLNGPIK